MLVAIIGSGGILGGIGSAIGSIGSGLGSIFTGGSSSPGGSNILGPLLPSLAIAGASFFGNQANLDEQRRGREDQQQFAIDQLQLQQELALEKLQLEAQIQKDLLAQRLAQAAAENELKAKIARAQLISNALTNAQTASLRGRSNEAGALTNIGNLISTLNAQGQRF